MAQLTPSPVPIDKRPIALTLEVARVDLLYQQNLAGLVALSVYVLSYLVVSWSTVSHVFLVGWAAILTMSGMARLIATFRWNRVKSEIASLRQVRRWLHFIQVMLLITGLGGGAVGLRFFESPSTLQQLITALSILFMSAGAVVCYVASTTAVLFVVLPAVGGLVSSLLLSRKTDLIYLGVLTGAYLVFGLLASARLGRYVLASLRLSVENSILASDLRDQVRTNEAVQGALRESQNRLELALQSSDAFVWEWDPRLNVMTSDGESRPLADFVRRFLPEDRRRFLDGMQHVSEENPRFEGDFARVIGGEIRHFSYVGSSQILTAVGEPMKVSGIYWDVTDKRTQETLRHERDVHEAANQAKSVFLANASHEIRTPLASINGFADVLIKTPDLPEAIRADLEVIVRNGKYLFSLVNDLLDLSRIEADRVYVQKSVLNIIAEIEDAMVLLRTSLNKKNLRSRVHYETRVPAFARTDGTRFRQIILNLLSNAIKFSNQGTVEAKIFFVSTSATAGVLSIVINDQGLGIPIEEQRTLFQPFVRGASRGVQQEQGSGLGLALSQKLARMLGGELRLVTSTIGRGSEFEFTLPLEIEPGTDFLRPLDHAIGESYGESGPPAVKPRELSSSTALSLMGAKILVVDDAADLRSLMQRYLVRQGAEVSLCADGLEAFEAASKRRFDIILMDMKMPVMSGYEASKKLRNIGYNRPIIAVTAHANIEDRQKCYEAGCDGYVSKPVDPKHLIHLLVQKLQV